MLLVAADSKVVRKHVTEGLDSFRRKNFSAAAKSFSDASLAMPNNAIIQFNRACAESKAQNREEARRLFRSAAAAKNGDIAKSAHYNLGCLETLEARAAFGDAPEDLSKDGRQKGIGHLTSAVKHFRETLTIDPDNKDARRNIEIIRLWLAEMRKSWKQLDALRESRPNQKTQNLADSLSKLDRDQHVVYVDSVQHIRQDFESSPAHLQNQKNVVDHLTKLQNVIDEVFDANQNQGAAGASIEARRNLIRGALTKQREEAETLASAALAKSEKHEHELAVPSQLKVIDNVNEMYGLVADFPHVARHALQLESSLLALTKPSESRRQQNYGKPSSMAEGNYPLERETRVAALATQLVPKAVAMARTLAAQQASQQVQQPISPGGPQKSGYERSIELAVELGPQVVELTNQTKDLLALRKVSDAVPLQEKTVELLQRIVEPLPNDQGNQQNQDEGDSAENLDQTNEDQDGEDEGDDKQEDQQGKQQQEKQIRNREQAEQLLRQVRDREQNLKEAKAQIRAMRSRRARVEKDW